MGDSGELSLGYMMGQNDGGGRGGNFGGSWGNDIIGLAVLALIFGRNGFGGGGIFGGGGGDCGAGCATQADVRAAVDQQTLISKLDQQTYGLADSTYALNNTINSGFYGVDRGLCDLSHQLSDCCCENRTAIADLKYTFATESCNTRNLMQNTTRDIIDSNNSNFRALNDVIRDGFAKAEARENKRYIAELERKLNACDRDSALQGLGTYLVNTLRPMPIPSYASCNPWAACYGFGGYGNNGGCGCGCG